MGFIIFFVILVYLLEFLINSITIKIMDKMWKYKVNDGYVYAAEYINIKKSNNLQLSISFVPFLNIYALIKMINNLFYVIENYNSQRK